MNKVREPRTLHYLILLAGLMMLIGCSGDDIIDGTGNDVKGTAAHGAPIANSRIQLRDIDGNIKVVLSDDNGSFNADISGMTPPILLRTKDALDNERTYYSIATEAGVSNITPLSDVIVRNWYANNNLDINSEFSSDVPLGSYPSVNEINKLVSALTNLLGSIYTIFSETKTYNFLRSRLDVNQTKFNDFLDKLEVEVTNNILTMQVLIPSGPSTVQVFAGFDMNELDISNDGDITPTVANNIQVTRNQNGLVVNWNESRDNGVVRYNIYRSTDNEPFTLVTPSPISFPVYSDTDVVAGAFYCYEIEAVDMAGNRIRSVASDTSCGETQSAPQTNCPASAAPSQLKLVGDQVELKSLLFSQINNHTWSIIEKPTDSAVTFIDANSSMQTVTLDVAGPYQFQVDITDPATNCNSKEVFLYKVIDRPSGLVGGPIALELSTELNIPSGIVSPGDFVFGEWKLVSAPVGFLPLALLDPLALIYVPTIVGQYSFQLTLIDLQSTPHVGEVWTISVTQPNG